MERSLIFTGLGTHERLVSHWYPLEGQHRKHEWSRKLLECFDDNLTTELIKEPKNSSLCKELHSAEPHTYKQGRTGQGCEGSTMDAMTIRWRSSGCREGAKKQKAGSQPWTSGAQSLASSRTCLEEPYGKWSWREEGSRRAGWFSKWSNPKIKNELLLTSWKSSRKPTWIKSCSWQNSDIKKKGTRGRSRVRWPWRNSETQCEHAGKGLGKPKLIWSWIWWRNWRVTSKAFKGITAKMEE